jgi:hypothetical protein
VTFVSFQVCGSQSTILDIAGARLGLTAGPMPGSLQLMYDDSATGALVWKSFDLHFSTAPYAGKDLAALPTLTVRIDPSADTWDLYSGGRLVAAGLPLIAAKRGDRKFTLHAGPQGAWVIGLVVADENPLYEDANANGIDDRFELQTRGTLVPATAVKAERDFLAQQWQAFQRTNPPPPFVVARPFSDHKGG